MFEWQLHRNSCGIWRNSRKTKRRARRWSRSGRVSTRKRGIELRRRVKSLPRPLGGTGRRSRRRRRRGWCRSRNRRKRRKIDPQEVWIRHHDHYSPLTSDYYYWITVLLSMWVACTVTERTSMTKISYYYSDCWRRFQLFSILIWHNV